MLADAAPVYVPKWSQAQTDVEKVDHTRRHAESSNSAAPIAQTAMTTGRIGANSVKIATATAPTASVVAVTRRDYNNNSYRRNGYNRRDSSVRLELNF